METITKVDANTIEIAGEVPKIQMTLQELLDRKAKLEKDMAENATLEAANLAVNEAELAKLNFRISEANKKGVVAEVIE